MAGGDNKGLIYLFLKMCRIKCPFFTLEILTGEGGKLLHYNLLTTDMAIHY